jgi:transcriptional regulator with XRE-family HTH domain
MTSPGPETSPKALLAQLLKTARQQSEYRTQEALAGAIGKERSTVGKTEQGDRVPAWEVLQDILTATGVTGLARTAIEGLWQVAKSTEEDAPVKAWFSGYLTAEGAAHTIRVWQPLIFHGLLQTPDYTRALLAAADLSDNEIQQQVQLREQRQAILHRKAPPNVIALIDESVLRRPVGAPEVMTGQCARLLDLPTSVVLQVVPSRVGANAGLGGAITLAAGTGKPEVLLAEALVEDVVTTDVPLVLKASATFDRVRACALSRADSRALITEAMETTTWRA